MTMLRIKEWLVKTVQDFGFVDGSEEATYAWNSIGAMFKAKVNLN